MEVLELTVGNASQESTIAGRRRLRLGELRVATADSATKPRRVVVSSALPQAHSHSQGILYAVSKRTVDILGSLLLLVLCSPLLFVVSILIKIKSPGPILFRQMRMGLNGKRFSCYKFRTMVVDAEKLLQENEELRTQYEAGFKIVNDPRITPLGAFLRRTSIDELPQLLNVLWGEMSLIGPRPLVGPELSLYGESRDKLLSIKPGLGCIWQACGRSNTTWDEHVEMDLLYADHRCLWLDIQLLALTAAAVFRGHGAY